MTKTFTASENCILNLCSLGNTFVFVNQKFTIRKVGKPRGKGKGGEPKTDIYILAINDKHQEKEFKISFKQKNYDFLENKIKLERAQQIFGPNADNIIKNSILKIRSKFESDHLIFIDRKGNTNAGSITLGWKFELLKILSGNKSDLMNLNKDQKVDVFAGTNLADNFKHALVNGSEVKNSGVANYIYVGDATNITLQNLFDNIIAIEDYVAKHEIYFGCKALNFRIYANKWDGDRPLAVYVDWKIINNKLVSNIIFDNPLEKKGNEMGNNIQN